METKQYLIKQVDRFFVYSRQGWVNVYEVPDSVVDEIKKELISSPPKQVIINGKRLSILAIEKVYRCFGGYAEGEDPTYGFLVEDV